MTASVSNAYFQRDDVLSETTVDPIKTKKLMEFLQISRQLTPAFQGIQLIKLSLLIIFVVVDK